MFHLQIQYTCDDLKEAVEAVHRRNSPRWSTTGKLVCLGGFIGLLATLLILTALVYVANGPGAPPSIVLRVYILILTDLFVLGIAVLSLVLILPASFMRAFGCLALILGIEIVLKSVGNAVFPIVPEAAAFPANTPPWIRFLGSNSLFWTFLLFVVWFMIYHKLIRATYASQWQLQQQLQLPTEVTLTDEMFRSRTATVDQQYQWQAFCRWLETPNLFILQPSSATMEIIPKRCCNDPGEVDLIRAMIEARVELSAGEQRIPASIE